MGKTYMLTKLELDVLQAFRRLEDDDAQGTWADYYATVVSAAGGNAGESSQVVRGLKRKGYLEQQDRGRHATFYLSEKGKLALQSHGR